MTADQSRAALDELARIDEELGLTQAPAEEDENGLALWQLIYGAIAHERLPLKVGQIEAAARRVADMLARREASKVQPKGTAAVMPASLHPVARRRVLDAIRDAYDLGYNDARNARTVPGDSAPGYKGRDVERDHGGALIHALEAMQAPAVGAKKC